MNIKINSDGKYLTYPGYTVIAMTKEKFVKIEEHIKNSVLSKYYSALPHESYHMTLFNIWSKNANLPPKLRKEMDPRITTEEAKARLCQGSDIYVESLGTYFFEKLRFEIDDACNKISWENFTVKPKGIYASGTLGVEVEVCKSMVENVKSIKEVCKKHCGKDDKFPFHITFAYKYKEVETHDVEEVKRKIFELRDMLPKHFELQEPGTYEFNDMTYFGRISDTMF
jgi:hypothetical protein